MAITENAEQSEYLRASQAATMLGVTSRTLRRLIRRGDVPAFQVSTRGDYRLKRSDVEAYRESCQVTPVEGAR